MYETSVEVYYKDIQNHIDYVDGADLLLNELLEGDLLSGDGTSLWCGVFREENSWQIQRLAKLYACQNRAKSKRNQQQRMVCGQI